MEGYIALSSFNDGYMIVYLHVQGDSEEIFSVLFSQLCVENGRSVSSLERRMNTLSEPLPILNNILMKTA